MTACGGGASARADVIGTPLVVEGVPLTIVGVTPPGFLGLEAGRAFDVAIPLATEPLVRKRATSTRQVRMCSSSCCG